MTFKKRINHLLALLFISLHHMIDLLHVRIYRWRTTIWYLISSSLYIIHAYITASGRGGLRGAGAGHPGARRRTRAAAAPGGAAVRGAAAGVRLRPGSRRGANP